MTVGVLEILTRSSFTAAGKALLGDLWDSEQEDYEARWLAEQPPGSTEGDLFLLGWRTENGISARLAIWKPVVGDCLFMLYARAANAVEEETTPFIQAVKKYCAEKGIRSLMGPMQFSTWHPYRFISHMGETGFFPGEQKLPVGYHRDFLVAGFVNIAEFQSSRVTDIHKSLQFVEAMGIPEKLAAYDVDTMAGRDLPQMLPEIHRVSSEIFKDNFGFTPIGLGDFLSLAAGAKAGEGGDESVLISVSLGGKLAGFAYGYAIGPYEISSVTAMVPKRNSAVLKTLGVLPEHRGLGLGYGLAYLFHKHWLERGCKSLIHAYMKTDNRSSAMSDHIAQPFRSYALMKGDI